MRSNSLALASSPRPATLSTDALVEPAEQANPADPSEAANQAPLEAPNRAFVAAPQWSSAQLLAGAEEATITHGDQVYRLRRTLTGKLILTK